MDYEKKYKEALERAKSNYNAADSADININSFKATLIDLFPELKESEDERIRKQIISFLKEFEHDHYRCLDFSSWVAWLKKQDEKVDAIESFDTEFEKQVSHLLASVLSKDYEYTEGFVKWVSSNLLGYAKHELGKQDEQKPNPYSGVSFEYNGHTWGMCARDGGVDIGYDKQFIANINPIREKDEFDNFSKVTDNKPIDCNTGDFIMRTAPNCD